MPVTIEAISKYKNKSENESENKNEPLTNVEIFVKALFNANNESLCKVGLIRVKLHKHNKVDEFIEDFFNFFFKPVPGCGLYGAGSEYLLKEGSIGRWLQVNRKIYEAALREIMPHHEGGGPAPSHTTHAAEPSHSTSRSPSSSSSRPPSRQNTATDFSHSMHDLTHSGSSHAISDEIDNKSNRNNSSLPQTKPASTPPPRRSFWSCCFKSSAQSHANTGITLSHLPKRVMI